MSTERAAAPREGVLAPTVRERLGSPALAAGVAAGLAGGLVVGVWPAASVVVAAVALVFYLARAAPPYAFAAAVVLFAFEGSLKILVETTGSPLPVEGKAFVAAALDVALVAAVVGLLLERRRWGWPLARPSRVEAVLLSLLPAWLVVSLLQIPLSPDLSRALAGFRLTQFYVLAAVGGALLLARARPREPVLRALLLGVMVAAAYATLRAAVGPHPLEFNFARATGAPHLVGDAFKTVGSFTGALGLVSYLAPAGVFAAALAMLLRPLRPLAAVLAAACGVAVVASLVRVGLVAVAVGFAVVLAGVVASRRFTRRDRLAVVAAVCVTGLAGVGGVALASGLSPEAGERARGILNPLADESLQIRLEIWREVLGDLRDDPQGAGLGTAGSASWREGNLGLVTDNSYVKIFFEQGVVGGALFVAAVIGALVAVVLRLRGADRFRWAVGTAAVAGFATFLVLALTAEYVEYPGKVFAWSLLGMAVWAAFARDEPERPA
jgi:hypothetical protein